MKLGNKSGNRVQGCSLFAGQRQAGSILLEVLIAFVVLAGGLLVVFRFHNTTQGTVAQAKITAEATALAEAKLEQVRGFIGTVDYLTLMSDDAGLEEYAGTDFVGNFTRTWEIDQNPYAGIVGEPWQINVNVSWKDRNDADQNVSLRSAVMGEDPSTGAGLLAMALHGGGDPIGDFVPHDPTQVGTGYGGGKVTIKYQGSDGEEYSLDDPLPDSVVLDTSKFSVFFTGTIQSVDGGKLVDVLLDGGPNDGGEETCLWDMDIGDTAVAFDPTLYDPDTGFPVYEDHFNQLHPGAWVDDSDPPVIVADPYLYSCKITKIPAGETWEGTITYVGEQDVPGPDDEVCIPNAGTTTLAFDENSPHDLQLGVVLVDRKSLCNLF